MNSNIDSVRDILSCAIEDNLYRVEELFAAKDREIEGFRSMYAAEKSKVLEIELELARYKHWLDQSQKQLAEMEERIVKAGLPV